MAHALRATIFVRLFNLEHLCVNYCACVAYSSNGFQSCAEHLKSVLFPSKTGMRVEDYAILTHDQVGFDTSMHKNF